MASVKDFLVCFLIYVSRIYSSKTSLIHPVKSARYDAVLMAGPTSIMHFCGLPTVTVAGEKKNADGVHEAVILYGKDECRLYEAALAIEQVIAVDEGTRGILSF